MKILDAKRGYTNYEELIPDFNNPVRGALPEFLDAPAVDWFLFPGPRGDEYKGSTIAL